MKKLTERTYLGPGYFHWFRNDEIGGISLIETTKEEYESLAGKDGFKNNPTLEGHTWMYSAGGTTKVDTPSGFLGVNECTIVDDKVVVSLEKGGVRKTIEVPLTALDAGKNIDETLWL